MNDIKMIIASVAKAQGMNIKKSYIRKVDRVSYTDVGNVAGYLEEIYVFEHKGENYLLNRQIVPNKEGSKMYSAKMSYEIIKM